jgi:flavin reductase (DIM6/NTAB) family NADH-FMN oxidoreductase RutF
LSHDSREHWSKKDTTVNIEREREFVINFVTESNYLLANQTSEEFPYGEDEIKKAGLSTLPSDVVGAVRVKESPIHFECKLRDILNYGEGAGGGTLITGEVVRVHVADELLDQGRIITSKFAPIGRGAGNDWFKTDSIIELERLMKAQIQK